jgi:hypothetical protein
MATQFQRTTDGQRYINTSPDYVLRTLRHHLPELREETDEDILEAIYEHGLRVGGIRVIKTEIPDPDPDPQPEPKRAPRAPAQGPKEGG